MTVKKCSILKRKIIDVLPEEPGENISPSYEESEVVNGVAVIFISHTFGYFCTPPHGAASA